MTKRDGLPNKRPGRKAADPDNPKPPGRTAKNRNPGIGKAPYNGPARRSGGDKPAGNYPTNVPAQLNPQAAQELCGRDAHGRYTPTARGILRQLAADRAFQHLDENMEAVAKRLRDGTNVPFDEALLREFAVAVLNRAEGAPKQVIEIPTPLPAEEMLRNVSDETLEMLQQAWYLAQSEAKKDEE